MSRSIRIIAPSGAIDAQYIDTAAARLRAGGYRVSIAEHAKGRHGRFAGTDDERAADINAALQDADTDIILCTRGGYGMQRIIDRIGEVHKPIVGFSDITELHQLAALHGQPSLHAIMCKHIATLSEDDETYRTTLAALRGEPLHYHTEAHVLNQEGEARGCIRGGNLSVLYGLQGTPYGLDKTIKQGDILLLEDIAERHYHIDRMMNNLRLSGVLQQLGGVIVGQWADCEDDESMGCSLMETIHYNLRGLNIPILFGLAAGHVERNLPIWLNTPATLRVTAEGGELIWDEMV